MAHVHIYLFVTLQQSAQEPETETKKVETLMVLLALQAGIPTGNAKSNSKQYGKLGIGAGFILLSNPSTWGKNKRNSPLRVGVEAGYTYYGRFISDVNINGYQGDYKTSYGIFQVNALLQVRPALPKR